MKCELKIVFEIPDYTVRVDSFQDVVRYKAIIKRVQEYHFYCDEKTARVFEDDWFMYPKQNKLIEREIRAIKFLMTKMIESGYKMISVKHSLITRKGNNKKGE